MAACVQTLSCEEIVVLDFETTGLSPQFDRVIEVAAIVVKGKNVVDSYVQLMDPKRYIPPFITDLTGITNAMIKGKPEPEKVMPQLKKFVGDRLIVAHNASFDKRFLLAEMERVNIKIENPFFCTMLLSRKLIPDASDHKLTTLARHLKIKSEQAHRALSDVVVTAKLWNHLYAKVADRTGIKKPNVNIIMAVSKKPKSALEKYFEKINSTKLMQ
ncbi:MAG: 3'-5' exonuclease [Oligoflexia bacterium]|nr:3'-5' exonuclease [Oligoflexia bacterium]